MNGDATVFWRSCAGSREEEFFREGSEIEWHLDDGFFTAQHNERDAGSTYRCNIETRSSDGINYQGEYHYNPRAAVPYDHPLPCQFRRYRSTDGHEAMIGEWTAPDGERRLYGFVF